MIDNNSTIFCWAADTETKSFSQIVSDLFEVIGIYSICFDQMFFVYKFGLLKFIEFEITRILEETKQ